MKLVLFSLMVAFMLDVTVEIEMANLVCCEPK